MNILYYMYVFPPKIFLVGPRACRCARQTFRSNRFPIFRWPLRLPRPTKFQRSNYTNFRRAPTAPDQNLAITVHLIGFLPADHGWSENVVQTKYPPDASRVKICQVSTHPNTQDFASLRVCPFGSIKFPVLLGSPASASRHSSPRSPVCASS